MWSFVMPYLLWLVFMGLLIGFLAVPLAQRIGYRYGRFGRTGDLLVVIVATVIGGLILTAIGSAIGSSLSGDGGAIVGGILGAIIALGLLTLFSTTAATTEPANTQEEIAGPYGTSSDRKQ
jgi:uncharacterized membrane protein YeaQ/YmgE (transglycosylase-associated protein family)